MSRRSVGASPPSAAGCPLAGSVRPRGFAAYGCRGKPGAWAAERPAEDSLRLPVRTSRRRFTKISAGGRCGCPRRRRSASDQETRDRAERGSAVRGSARASVVAEEDTRADRPRDDVVEAKKTGRLSDPFYLWRRMRGSRSRPGGLERLRALGFDRRDWRGGLQLSDQIQQHVAAVE